MKNLLAFLAIVITWHLFLLAIGSIAFALSLGSKLAGLLL